MKKTINFDDFLKIDLRVGTVREAERVEKSNKLLKLKIDLGEEIGIKQIVSGIVDDYRPEDLIEKQIVMVVNLEPREIMGLVSEGMLLAGGEEEVALLTTDKKVKNGTEIH